MERTFPKAGNSRPPSGAVLRSLPGEGRQLSGQERLQLAPPAGFSRVEGCRACLLGQLGHGPHHLPSLRPVRQGLKICVKQELSQTCGEEGGGGGVQADRSGLILSGVLPQPEAK